MPRAASASERYARYVLGVLVLVYVFNFLDRQILAILAERIRGDLGVRDDQLGFLYGTAFAVFYAVFGIPLGRLADVWDRRKLIALGLAVWSLMTVLSGFARSFPELALARIGVGIGEASAAPAAFSLLSDYFPPARRATVLAIYSSGIYLGAGLGLAVGGVVVEGWEAAYPGAAPFGLRGWQAAFLVVGLPGLLLALWVRTLREPVRGASEGLATAPEAAPWRAFGRELRAVVPPLTLLHLWLSAGAPAVARNLLAAVLITGIVALLVATLGSPAQWIALGIGLYAAVSWLQALAVRDRPTFALMTRTPSLPLAAVGFALLAFVGYAMGFWLAPFFMRVHGVPAGRAGLTLGLVSAVAGWLGTTLGGLWADARRLRTPAGRLQVGMACGLVALPLGAWMLSTASTTLAFALAFPATLVSSLWIGPGASTVQDLVLPRMRGSASAAYLLVVTFVGLALGPYTVGRLSVALGDLRTAMLCALGAGAAGAGFLLLAARHIARDEATRLARAVAAGEPRDAERPRG
jgi:MFS family permease